MTKPDCLMARILKARHFKESFLLQASPGPNPTCMRRSILAAQDLLQEGYSWTVVTWMEVKIWGDRWLMDDVNQCVETPMVAGQDEMRVAELIEDRECKNDLVRSIFSNRDANLILAIPLTYRRRDVFA